MRPNEIRIGNLVWKIYAPYGHEQSRDYEVIDLDDMKLLCSPGGSFLLAPIEITDKLLLKAGFTEDRIGRYCLERLTISKDSCWWYSIDCTDYDGDTGTVLTEIKYIHQLENLYLSLHNEPLNIQL